MTDKTPPFKTKTGRVLTDAGIGTLADEAERGYDVEVFEDPPTRSADAGIGSVQVVPVRLDPDLEHAVEQRVEAERTTTSEIIREALRRFLEVA